MLDLHRPVLSDPIRMAYVAAVRDARSPGAPAVGLVVFTIDPQRTLCPMLGSWPTAMRVPPLIVSSAVPRHSR